MPAPLSPLTPLEAQMWLRLVLLRCKVHFQRTESSIMRHGSKFLVMGALVATAGAFDMFSATPAPMSPELKGPAAPWAKAGIFINDTAIKTMQGAEKVWSTVGAKTIEATTHIKTRTLPEQRAAALASIAMLQLNLNNTIAGAEAFAQEATLKVAPLALTTRTKAEALFAQAVATLTNMTKGDLVGRARTAVTNAVANPTELQKNVALTATTFVAVRLLVSLLTAPAAVPLTSAIAAASPASRLAARAADLVRPVAHRATSIARAASPVAARAVSDLKSGAIVAAGAVADAAAPIAARATTAARAATPLLTKAATSVKQRVGSAATAAAPYLSPLATAMSNAGTAAKLRVSAAAAPAAAGIKLEAIRLTTAIAEAVAPVGPMAAYAWAQSVSGLRAAKSATILYVSTAASSAAPAISTTASKATNLARAAMSATLARMPPPVTSFIRTTAADGRLTSFVMGLLIQSAFSIALGPIFARTPIVVVEAAKKTPVLKAAAARISGALPAMPKLPPLVQPVLAAVSWAGTTLVARPVGWARALAAKVPIGLKLA